MELYEFCRCAVPLKVGTRSAQNEETKIVRICIDVYDVAWKRVHEILNALVEAFYCCK